MTLVDTIRDFLPPVDPRNPREIECDIEDEFSFHLDMLEREERAAGCDEATAESQARKRFGDIDRFRKKCKKIALEERVMLQRINLVLSIVVLLFVGLVGWQVWTTQKYNTLALQAITSDLAKMKFDAEAEAREGTNPDATAAPQTADGNIQQFDTNAVDYDLRDLPGVWRLVDRDDLPQEFQILVIGDSGPSVPEGIVKPSAKPRATIESSSLDFKLELRFEPMNRTVGEKRFGLVAISIFRLTRYSHLHTPAKSSGLWDPQAPNQIAIDFTGLLTSMTAEKADAARTMLNRPLVYERVTAPYSDVVKVGWPVHYHLLGDIPNPGPRKMSAREPLMLQKVLWEQNFGEIENGVADLFIPTVNGPRRETALRANGWEHEAYASIEVPADSVIYITRDASQNAESSAAAKPQSSQGLVYIDGDVLRRGTYALPNSGKLTLARFLVSAGVSLESDHLVTVRRKSDGAVLQDLMVDIPVTKLKEDATLDIVIEADDLVIVNSSN